MKAEQTSPMILRKMGLEALWKSLGPLGMVRFLQQYETGTGDYSKERSLWLKGISIDSIAVELRRRRTRKKKIR